MKMNLVLLPGSFAICRLAPDAPMPVWARGEFVSATRTNDELAIICLQDRVLENVERELDWRCLRVDGRFELTKVGVLAALAMPLAKAKISVFVIGTFDTDYLLVKDSKLSEARAALEQAGHRVCG
jgi:hypothetical protein